MKNILKTALVAILCLALFAACGNNQNGENQGGATYTGGTALENISSTLSDFEKDETSENATTVTLTGNGATVSGENSGSVIVSGSVVTISAGGSYVFSGTLDDGQIVVSTAENVQIVLNGANITNKSGSAIYVAEAKNAKITVAAGTENTLADGETYASEDTNACIYAKDDLVINGTGKLTVYGNSEKGINARDDLVILNANLAVYAKEKGIIGKDSVYLGNAAIYVECGADGIKSSNDTDADKGTIVVAGGSYEINCAGDGIVAETKVQIESGTIKITTAGGAVGEVSTFDSAAFGGGFTGFGGFGGFGGSTGTSGGTSQTTTSDTSTKGIKGLTSVLILGGDITISSVDDAIHSNGDVEINGGSLTLETLDDGVHADNALSINGGTISVTKSYEGLEGLNVAINGGTISVVSADDGINAAGGAGATVTGGMFGRDSFSGSGSSSMLAINGGTIYVSAGGDGIDSNGEISISGGNVTVEGPTDSANEALDCETSINISGGTVVAISGSQMASMGTDNSTAYVVKAAFKSTASAGSVLRLEDADGNEIVSFESSKAFSNVTLASPKLKNNGSYKLYLNGTLQHEFTVSSTITTLGSVSGGFNGAGGGMGGRPSGGNRP